MSNIIPSDIYLLLEKAFDEKIVNFEIENQGVNDVGQGYMGDILFLILKNKNTGEQHHVVVKQVLHSSSESVKDFMTHCYLGEINFYTKVVPTYMELQKSYPKSQRFDNVPKCLATTTERGKEKLLLENLKYDNYELHPKKIPVTDEMYEKIFELYGRYHGLSYALKIHEEEKFWKLVNLFSNNFNTMLERGLLDKAFSGALSILKTHLNSIGEEEMSKKMEKYIENRLQMFVDDITYKSPFSVILHGDCWGNNFMYKYSKSRKIEDIKLLDFQMVMCGSPVLDLTYTFYSGAAKETLDKLDHFLHIYYDSVKDTLKQYDCDIEKVFSFEDLQKEWKEHNTFGYLMGLVIWMNKNEEIVEKMDVVEIMEKNRESDATVERLLKNYNNEGFRKRATDLTRHMYANCFL